MKKKVIEIAVKVLLLQKNVAKVLRLGIKKIKIFCSNLDFSYLCHKYEV